MSTRLHDLPNAAVLGKGLNPQAITASTNGSSTDLLTGDGRCTCLQHVGAVSGPSPGRAPKRQESDDGTSWTDVNTGAFPSNVTAANNLQALAFNRTKRYVRWAGTVTGTTPSFTLGVIILEQKKQF